MTLIDQIRELIAEGETERSLDELYKYVKENNADVIDTLVMLRNRLRGIQEEVIRGTMDNQAASLERAKVNDAILKLLPQLTPEYMAKAAAWQAPAQPMAAAAKAKAPAASSGEKRKWMLIGGGAALLLIIILIAVSGGGGDDNSSPAGDEFTAEETTTASLLNRIMAAHGGYAVWVSEPNDNGAFSTFVHGEDASFTEYSADGEVFATFSVQEDTPEYVALYDEVRQMALRIYETEAFFQNPGDTEWNKWMNGQWVTPE